MTGRQIRPDPYDTDTWDVLNFGQVCVHMLDVKTCHEITGGKPPDCPVRTIAVSDS
jgi:hypothetical protein